jgi:large exoprotein involved in heme utilization and adhesion
VLLTPVQGSEGLRDQYGDPVAASVRRALEARGYSLSSSRDSLGHALVACQTPECTAQVLDAAGAAFAIVPAVWSRMGGGEELTLSLVQRTERNLNDSGTLGDDLDRTSGELLDALLLSRATSASAAAGTVTATPNWASGTEPEPRHPHAWKAGPIVLILGGAASLIAVGVAAAMKTEGQQLNGAAAGAWSAIGAAAIGGGIAWWVVGARRRKPVDPQNASREPAVALHGSGIDLRLRF